MSVVYLVWVSLCFVLMGFFTLFFQVLFWFVFFGRMRGSKIGSLLKNFVIHDLKSPLEFQSWSCPYQSLSKNIDPLSESGWESDMINIF